MTSLTKAAGEYLGLGLAVIALTGKTPNVKVHPHGLYDALRGAPESDADWEFIARFMDHKDTTGVGILVEYPYVVADLDGEEGAKQWREIAGDDWMPDRWVAKTGRGLHLWFSCITPTGTIKLGPKLDLKSAGGYVAAPPSVHPDGPIYEWLLPPDQFEPPMEVPDGLAREIEEHVADLKMSLDAKAVRRRAWGPRWKEGDHVYYAQPGHDGLLKGMAEAGEGNRNAYLHWAAATMEEEGASDELFEALYDAAIKVGLTREESKRTIRSARRLRG